jgi:molecular chaperone GrpE
MQEEPPKEALRAKPREAGKVYESVEAVGPEHSGVPSEATEGSLAGQASEDPFEKSSEITSEETSALIEKLELAHKERDEHLDSMRRMKAELKNSHARLEREHARLDQLASERIVKEFLPLLDNLERALEAEGDIKEGVQTTQNQLVDLLAQEGLNPISSEGQSFDPAVHEALMSQPSDKHDEDIVIQTLERGYLLNGKPIRMAKVVISKRV